MITIGLDIGSTAAKGVLLSEQERRLALVPTGWSPRTAGQQLVESLLGEAGIGRKEVGRIVATGYGRIAVQDTDKAITEITCHARGIAELLPDTRMVIDIGGQDSKVMLLGKEGRVVDFAMNDKCAAGTGRFLQVMANAMDLDVAELAEVEELDSLVSVSSMCTVFAESEVISQLAQGKSRAGLIAGLHQSVAKRVAGMASRMGIAAPIAFTGGVALNTGIKRALERELKQELFTPMECQYSGALGAALLARELK